MITDLLWFSSIRELWLAQTAIDRHRAHRYLFSCSRRSPEKVSAIDRLAWRRTT